MKLLMRTNDPTEIAFAKALLQGEGIDCFELDVNMSILEGGIGIFPRRLMVAEECAFRSKTSPEIKPTPALTLRWRCLTRKEVSCTTYLSQKGKVCQH